MGSTDLINFWSHFTEFLSFHGLWYTTHFLRISGQTWWKYSLGAPDTWLTFVQTSLNFHHILAFDWSYTFHAFWINLLELWLGDRQLWLRFSHTSLNFHLPLIVWALAAHFQTYCSWDWAQILWKYWFQLSIYLINFWLCFTAFSVLPDLWLT